jgi:hypothetical protein
VTQNADSPELAEQKAALSQRAQKLADHWRKAETGQQVIAPIIAEFAGSPKSGKSTTIDIVGHFFKRMGFRVWAPTEGASKRTPYTLKDDLVAFNTWALNYAISELLVALHSREGQQLILMDRGPFDVLAWLGLLRQEGELEKEEYDTIAAYALHQKWISRIDRLYLFTADPAVSLERETRSKLTLREGRAMNPTRLAVLLQQYSELQEGILKGYPLKRVESKETSTMVGTALEIADDLLDLMQARLAASQKQAS